MSGEIIPFPGGREVIPQQDKVRLENELFAAYEVFINTFYPFFHHVDALDEVLNNQIEIAEPTIGNSDLDYIDEALNPQAVVLSGDDGERYSIPLNMDLLERRSRFLNLVYRDSPPDLGEHTSYERMIHDLTMAWTATDILGQIIKDKIITDSEFMEVHPNEFDGWNKELQLILTDTDHDIDIDDESRDAMLEHYRHHVLPWRIAAGVSLAILDRIAKARNYLPDDAASRIRDAKNVRLSTNPNFNIFNNVVEAAEAMPLGADDISHILHRRHLRRIN